MLKEILSVSGKSGLYKLISQGKNMLIAESLIDGKRIPVYMRDKAISLGDIAIYTLEKEIPLAKVLTKMKEKEDGKEIVYNPATIQPVELRSYFESIIPDYDKEKVYPSDMKKMMSWYNLLLSKGLTDFEEKEEESKQEESKQVDE